MLLLIIPHVHTKIIIMSKTTAKPSKPANESGQEELKTEGPLAEKDEVKAAERRTAKQQKSAGQASGNKK